MKKKSGFFVDKMLKLSFGQKSGEKQIIFLVQKVKISLKKKIIWFGSSWNFVEKNIFFFGSKT